MPGLDEREIMWGELLRFAWRDKYLSGEQRFNLYREINVLNVIPPEAIYRCMKWELMEVKPDDATYAGWKKTAKAVLREITKRAGRGLSAEEASTKGRIFLNDVVRARPLSWCFTFKEIEKFDYVRNEWTPYRPDECWYCGNNMPPAPLVTLLLAGGWMNSGLYNWPMGGTICMRCVLSSPEIVSARATKRERDKEKVFCDDDRRSIEIAAARLRMFPSLAEIRGYDAARALARFASKSPTKGDKAA